MQAIGTARWGDRGTAGVRTAAAIVCHVQAVRDTELGRLLSSARDEFGMVAFWNAPRLSNPFEDAIMVIRRLRKYGGRAGWKAASAITAALERGAETNGADGAADQGIAPDRLQPIT